MGAGASCMSRDANHFSVWALSDPLFCRYFLRKKAYRGGDFVDGLLTPTISHSDHADGTFDFEGSWLAIVRVRLPRSHHR